MALGFIERQMVALTRAQLLGDSLAILERVSEPGHRADAEKRDGTAGKTQAL